MIQLLNGNGFAQINKKLIIKINKAKMNKEAIK